MPETLWRRTHSVCTEEVKEEGEASSSTKNGTGKRPTPRTEDEGDSDGEEGGPDEPKKKKRRKEEPKSGEEKESETEKESDAPDERKPIIIEAEGTEGKFGLPGPVDLAAGWEASDIQTLQHEQPQTAHPSQQQQHKLHLSIRLVELPSKQPVAWGSIVAHNTELAIAVHNPDPQVRIRVVCHVTDKNERRIDNVNGKLVVDIPPKESTVMCSFRALATDGPVQLHFLAAGLPLVPDRPLFHTRLFLNVASLPPIKM